MTVIIFCDWWILWFFVCWVQITFLQCVIWEVAVKQSWIYKKKKAKPHEIHQGNIRVGDSVCFNRPRNETKRGDIEQNLADEANLEVNKRGINECGKNTGRGGGNSRDYYPEPMPDRDQIPPHTHHVLSAQSFAFIHAMSYPSLLAQAILTRKNTNKKKKKEQKRKLKRDWKRETEGVFVITTIKESCKKNKGKSRVVHMW